jgi:hypothetical protein
MGATTFTTVAAGKTAVDAYHAAVKDAHYWHGHGGYSGTIAEKSGCVEYTLPARITGEKFVATVWNALDEKWQAEGAKYENKPAPKTPNLATLEKWFGKRDAARILEDANDKWGPAVVVRLGKTEGAVHIPKTPTGKCKAGYSAYLFFGLASC